VPAATAVGVDDDLAAGQADVAVRAADLEAAGRVDVDVISIVPPVAEDGLEDVLDDFFVQVALLFVPAFVVLGREHNRVDADRLAAVVLDGDLALGVGAQALDHLLAADRSMVLDETVGKLNRQRHQLRGFAAGEAKHHALIARALRGQRPWRCRPTVS
jgi:hypothetical protein